MAVVFFFTAVSAAQAFTVPSEIFVIPSSPCNDAPATDFEKRLKKLEGRLNNEVRERKAADGAITAEHRKDADALGSLFGNYTSIQNGWVANVESKVDTAQADANQADVKANAAKKIAEKAEKDITSLDGNLSSFIKTMKIVGIVLAVIIIAFVILAFFHNRRGHPEIHVNI